MKGKCRYYVLAVSIVRYCVLPVSIVRYFVLSVSIVRYCVLSVSVVCFCVLSVSVVCYFPDSSCSVDVTLITLRPLSAVPSVLLASSSCSLFPAAQYV
jgi:hypothetical protein